MIALICFVLALLASPFNQPVRCFGILQRLSKKARYWWGPNKLARTLAYMLRSLVLSG
jgi:hypothetical protein